MTDAFHKDCQIFTEAGHTTQLTAYYESARRIVWLMMHTHPRPSFNPALLDDVEAVFRAVRDSKLPIDFFISGSTVPHMYNTGGDLSLFSQAIRQRQRDVLSSYATRCIDILCHLDGGFGRNVITLALVEGSALGGGFEAALAHISCWRSAMQKWDFQRFPSIFSPAWGLIHLSDARRGKGWPSS